MNIRMFFMTVVVISMIILSIVCLCKSKLNKKVKVKVLIGVALLVCVSAFIGVNVYADGVKADIEISNDSEEKNAIGNINLPRYRWYDLAFADIQGIENFRNLTMEIDMKGFPISEDETTSTVFFKNMINVYTEIDGGKTREPRKLMQLVFDKKEDKVIPIYSPSNTLEQAIKTDYEHGVNLNVIWNRYPVSSTNDILNIIKGNSNISDSLKNTDMNKVVEADWYEGIDYIILKERYGIDDNYIKYYLETIPKRKGVPESKTKSYLNW